MLFPAPADYNPQMDIRQTEVAIKQIKDYFEKSLSEALDLTRVSAPLFVFPESGLNDDLNGVERPVSFDVKDADGRMVEIVHSLAKWKRSALKRYGFRRGEGLYTDMNAIRRDETLDNVHSVYVDQWDWEKLIAKEERSLHTLEETVNRIYMVFKNCERYITGLYPFLPKFLPEKLTFITSLRLEDLYPGLPPKERENAICREHGAVFLTQIGGALRSGEPHDMRAPDYDDWALNGDLLFWYPVLDCALELSSMGVRVDEEALLAQTKLANCEDRLALEFHQSILSGEMPCTIGGGLGQSRICMFLLGRAHIGEVQASVWPPEMVKECARKNICLL